MHAITKFRMRRRGRYECDVPHPLPLDGKYRMFCSRENKQSQIYKIGVLFHLQNSSMFPHEVIWNTHGTCALKLDSVNSHIYSYTHMTSNFDLLQS